MKKKLIIPIVIVAVLFALLYPFHKGVYDDGGTEEYDALLYKIVEWNRIQVDANEDEFNGETQIYHNRSVYWFPDNQKSIEELWEIEKSGR